MKNFVYSLGIIASIIIITGCKSKSRMAEACDSTSAAMNVVACDTATVIENNTEEPTIAHDASANTNTPKDRKFIKTVTVKFRVKNVRKATEQIENIAFSLGGYVIESNLYNDESFTTQRRIARDSFLLVKSITVQNNMVFKIPSDRIDTLLRLLNPVIDFLDNRNISLKDVTYDEVRNIMQTNRLETYDKRQEANIDNKNSKLKDASNTEEIRLERQMQSDELKIRNKELEYNINFCTLNVDVYQNPIVIRNVIEDEEYQGRYVPNLFTRLTDALIKGWSILESIVVFIVGVWPIYLIALIVLFFIYVPEKLKRKKQV